MLTQAERLVFIFISIIIAIVFTENSNYVFVLYYFEATQTEAAIHSEALGKLLQERSLELYNLRKELKEKRFCYANLTLEDLQFYTGITSKELIRWVLSMIEDKSKIFAKSSTLEDHLLIVLMKLKLELCNRDISIRFGIKTQLTSKILATAC